MNYVRKIVADNGLTAFERVFLVDLYLNPSISSLNDTQLGQRMNRERDSVYKTIKSLCKKGRIRLLEDDFNRFIQCIDPETGLPVSLVEVQSTLREYQSDLFVYLMTDSANGLTKIGFSKNPKVRERTLQSEKPSTALLDYWPGNSEKEKTLHGIFAGKRIRGEWFNLSQDDIAFISNFFAPKTNDQ